MVSAAKVYKDQKKFFYEGKTLDIKYRIAALNLLKTVIKRHEQGVMDALHKDLKKSETESYVGEISGVYHEIDLHIKNLRSWSRAKNVLTPKVLFPSKSVILKEPYGSVLIIAPWNYPFQLALMPLIGAISAGNTAVVKPSEHSPSTTDIIDVIIREAYAPEYVTVIKGGEKETEALLEQPFDKIFFTGSPAVGRIVMGKAALNLTPVILELGGKSPAIIDETADLKTAAKRIAFGKVSNAGQICIAPDYALVHKSRKDEFIEAYKFALNGFFKVKGENDEWDLTQMTGIINDRHFKRLKDMLNADSHNVIIGGKYYEETLKMEPALIDKGEIGDYIGEARSSCKKGTLMGEEIFGPFLPLITYEDIEDVIEMINRGEKPLAMYYFTKDEDRVDNILRRISFGGGCINDTIMHFINSNLPFGGVGQSGMGSYHGKRSFDVFTHEKGVLINRVPFDLKVRYMPYTERAFKFIKKIF